MKNGYYFRILHLILSTINFDTTFKGRNEIQKNKWTPHCLAELNGEYGFKKKRLLNNKKYFSNPQKVGFNGSDIA